MSRLQLAILIAVVTIMSAARFVGMEFSPPGFYVDESAGAANVLCLKQTGRGELGAAWPLFFPAYDPYMGAYFSAPYIYPLAGWTILFGESIGSFRLFSAFLSALSLIGIFFVGSVVGDRKTGWLCILAGAVSPWIFQFARIAWDPAILPCLIVWALYFTLRSRHWWDGAAAGLLFAAAAYAYPPARAQLAFFLPVLAWFRYARSGLDRPFATAFVLTISLVSVPLVYATLTGEIQGRWRLLSVFSHDHLQGRYGSTSAFYGWLTFAKNVVKHFSPDFLFYRGDFSARSSTKYVGLLSGLDMLTLLALLAGSVRINSKCLGFLLLCVSGYLSAVAAASFTWDWIPQAMRSIGGAPFLVLFTGTVLREAIDRFKPAASVILAVSIAFSTYFLWAFFAKYPHIDPIWFDNAVVESAKANLPAGRWERFLAENHLYLPSGLHYYLMAYGNQTCTESAARLRDAYLISN
jgi:hypothetical protein